MSSGVPGWGETLGCLLGKNGGFCFIAFSSFGGSGARGGYQGTGCETLPETLPKVSWQELFVGLAPLWPYKQQAGQMLSKKLPPPGVFLSFNKTLTTVARLEGAGGAAQNGPVVGTTAGK